MAQVEVPHFCLSFFGVFCFWLALCRGYLCFDPQLIVFASCISLLLILFVRFLALVVLSSSPLNMKPEEGRGSLDGEGLGGCSSDVEQASWHLFRLAAGHDARAHSQYHLPLSLSLTLRVSVSL